MAVVAGIRFRKAGKVYYFDPTDVWPKPGDPVVSGCINLQGALTVRADASTATVGVTWSNAASTSMSDRSFLIDGVTYVPFRAFCALADNCEVSWSASTKTAYATTSTGAKISARVGS